MLWIRYVLRACRINRFLQPKQKSAALYAAMNDMTTLLQNHTEHLELASSTASTIHSTLEKAAASAGSWNDNFMLGGSMGNYALRVITPLTALILGNYGLPPSFSRNAALLLGGKLSLLIEI